ncbi:MAG: HEAT repeat domain-containing protein [Sedimentisphaerales bacterium]
MLTDPAVVVRIAAAHALCDWGNEKEALPVLTEALKSKTDKARLFAVTALNKIGEKARPVLRQIRPVLKDSDTYVKLVARATVSQLNGG